MEEKAMLCFEMLVCREAYTPDMPLSLPYRQSPPMPDPASKQSNGTFREARTLLAARPDGPAPMTHVLRMTDRILLVSFLVPTWREVAVRARCLTRHAKLGSRRHLDPPAEPPHV
jgi:hypothetical protein